MHISIAHGQRIRPAEPDFAAYRMVVSPKICWWCPVDVESNQDWRASRDKTTQHHSKNPHKTVLCPCLVFLTINKLGLTRLDPAVTQYRFARIWPAVRHPGISRDEGADSWSSACTLHCTLHQRSKHTSMPTRQCKNNPLCNTENPLSSTSSNRMLTRAMRGAHLALRGITFGDRFTARPC